MSRELINELQMYMPGTAEHDATTSGFQLLAPHRPEHVISARTPTDVQAAIAFAMRQNRRISVQATGHGRTRTVPPGGVLVSTAAMNSVKVDVRERTAWVEAGATWREVIDEAAPHGLAPLSGSFPGVGAVGYTLGGGVGLMARKYGFAADHVRRIELATTDGRLRTVTSESDPDLFWALRGGGGNFGVVTGMEIDLVPVSGIYGGSLFFDLALSPEIVNEWLDWTAGVSDEMTSAVTALTFPDLPTVPEFLRGRHIVQIHIAFVGAEDDAESVLGPLRCAGTPVIDTLRELPFSESGTIFDEPDEPHAYRGGNRLLRTPDPEKLREVVGASGPSAPVMTIVGIRHLGGALSRQPSVSNAIAHRAARYCVSVLSVVHEGEEEFVDALHHEHLARFGDEALGTSLNFSFSPMDEQQVSSAYSQAGYARLRQLRHEYDPRKLLHANHEL